MTDNQLTYQIRGAIFEVYNTLGPGLLESVYEEALVFELQQQGLKVDRQVEVPISYKGNSLKTPLRLDLLIENTIIVELKSVEEMKSAHDFLHGGTCINQMCEIFYNECKVRRLF